MVALSSIIGRGATGSKPAAGTEGRLYYSTDTGVLERDNGSSWDSVEGTTGGIGGAPADATYITTSSNGSLSAEILLSAVIGYGVAASRPAAGTEGRLYYSTDTDRLERDNGATWDLLTIDWTTGISGKPTLVTAHSDLSGLGDDDHTQYQKESEKSAASGYASLDGSTKVPIAELPIGTGASEVALGNHTHTGQVVDLNLVIGDGVNAITTGVKGDVAIDFAGTIVSATLLADQSGSIVIDIWKDSYANFPPTVADTITASAKPTLSAAAKSQDATLTGWTTSVSAGDIIRLNVDSAATVTRVTLALKIQRS